MSNYLIFLLYKCHLDTRNGLTCIARRVAVEEKRNALNKVEQFTTRINREGIVVDLDIR